MQATIADFEKREARFSNKQRRDDKVLAMRKALENNDMIDFLQATKQKTRFNTIFQTACEVFLLIA